MARTVIKNIGKLYTLAGLVDLFTSEPTTRDRYAFGATLRGRFTIQRGMSAAAARSLAAGEWLSCTRQALLWNTKKVSKRVGGERYLQLRRLLLGHDAGVRWGDQS